MRATTRVGTPTSAARRAAFSVRMCWLSARAPCRPCGRTSSRRPTGPRSARPRRRSIMPSSTRTRSKGRRIQPRRRRRWAPASPCWVAVAELDLVARSNASLMCAPPPARSCGVETLIGVHVATRFASARPASQHRCAAAGRRYRHRCHLSSAFSAPAQSPRAGPAFIPRAPEVHGPGALCAGSAAHSTKPKYWWPEGTSVAAQAANRRSGH